MLIFLFYKWAKLRKTKNLELNLELNPLGRLGIAIRLVRVFAFMHNSPIGKRINCDMTKVTRALSQFLVTEDYRIGKDSYHDQGY